MLTALIYPPACDPTAPYIAVPALTGFLRSRGKDVMPVDANLEAWEWLLRPVHLKKLGSDIGREIGRLERKNELAHTEQLALGALWNGYVHRRSVPRAISDALAVLKDKNRFFDADVYGRAVQTVTEALELVSAAYTPLELGFAGYRTPFGLLTVETIRADIQPDRNPFHGYYADDLVHRLAAAGTGVVGLSAAFTGQILQAYALATVIREQIPESCLVLGGAAVTQMFLRLDPAAQERALGPFDAVVTGEGEQALLDVVEGYETGVRPHGVLPCTVPVPLEDLPAPDFDGLPLGRYFSPAAVLPYDTTRGCYWGRCAFCHYGLTPAGTAAYRERPSAAVLTHLAHLRDRHACRVFHLSQDAMQPALARALAKGVQELRLDIRWASDLRPEPDFASAGTGDLAAGGCLAVSLGIESAAPHMLRKMAKGIRAPDLPGVIHAFAASGIAVEAMLFTGFPGETYTDAMASLGLLRDAEENIALFMCGRFGLESGSAVARHPDRFGIETWYAAGDELKLGLLWEESRTSKRPSQEEQIDAELDRLAQRRVMRPYPWAGSLSTAHSLLWFERRGPGVFRDLTQDTSPGRSALRPARTAVVPDRIQAMYEEALERETLIWETMLNREREVSPDLYRRLCGETE